jgi:hypothetical protein
MANTFTTMTQVARTAVALLSNKLGVVATANNSYEKEFDPTGSWDRGASIKVRQPNRFTVGDGEVISSIPDITEDYVDLTLSYRKNVSMGFSTAQLTHYAKEDFTARFIAPAVENLANKVEGIVINEMAQKLNYYVGVAGTTPSTYKDMADVDAMMNLLGMPQGNRHMVWNEKDFTSFVSNANLQNSFNTSINTNINRRRFVGELSNLMHFKTALTPVQQAGTGDAADTPATGYVGAGDVKTTVTSGTAIILQNLANNSTFKTGDKIRFAGIYSVNPQDPERNTGELMTFTITTNATSGAGTEATIAVSPAIRSASTDPKRNISNTSGILSTTAASIATANSGAGSTTLQQYRLNIAYHPDAVLFAAPPLAIPASVVPNAAGRHVDKQTGISIRIYEYLDGTNDRANTRMDILFGVRINPEYMVGLLGGAQ